MSITCEVIAIPKSEVILGLMKHSNAFGLQLKSLRTARQQSQMALALSANVSTRHLSYLETGKAQPSREMVVQLTHAMDIPLRTRNQMLVAAGFAPMYSETPMDSPVLGPVRDALKFVLQAMEPNPTFIVNRRYDIIDANSTGAWLLKRFTAMPEKFPSPINLAKLITQPDGMKDFIQNLEEVHHKVLTRLRRDLSEPYSRDQHDEKLLAEIAPALEALRAPHAPSNTPPLFAGLNLKRGDIALNLFTTIATIGTAQDVTLQELRIETLFPGDPATRKALSEKSI
jgi:transcriptional regulator with XRE-family HTH domain